MELFALLSKGKRIGDFWKKTYFQKYVSTYTDGETTDGITYETILKPAGEFTDFKACISGHNFTVPDWPFNTVDTVSQDLVCMIFPG